MKALLSLTVLAAAALLAHAGRQTRPEVSPVAPEFVGKDWINSKPISLASRRGKPTLVAFWTFGCSNCQANLPSYNRLYSKYKSKGVELIAIHTPETSGERKLSNVVDHVGKYGIQYPVLIDNDSNNWYRYKVQYWPTLFLIDGDGKIRCRWEGELQYAGGHGEEKMAAMIDRMLAVSG